LAPPFFGGRDFDVLGFLSANGAGPRAYLRV
jgi:hypothetical protein